MIKTIGLAIISAGLLAAQDAGEKVNVPLHDPYRPPRIHAQLLLGSINVRGAEIKDVEVETHSSGDHERHEQHPPSTEGMKRLTFPEAGLDVSEDDNVVNIKTASWHTPVDLVITVPRHSSLDLKSISNGDIHVEHVDGEIDADDMNGRIVLRNVSGSVVAHSLNGEVLATFDRVEPSKPMSFSTLNGNIDVTLPDDVKADVRMKTDNGDIYSDFDVKLESGEHRAREVQREHGEYHVRFDRTLRGTINGGGPEYQFTSFNGQIYIRKKK
jgi:DUF4097 and DUF4098 domain-containing protein YvlB